MGILKSIYFGLMVLVLTLYHAFFVFFLSLHSFLRKKEFPSDAGHLLGIKWGRRIMACSPWWKVRIEGQNHLPRNGTPYILVANHESASDIFSIFLLGIQFKWLAKYELFQIPILGYCMHKLGYIPVKRGDKNTHRDVFISSRKWINRGFSVLFFPEGTRSTDGTVKKFKIGAFKLALETNVPILPIVLSGTGKMLKKGSLEPKSAQLLIKVLPPVNPPLVDDADLLAQRVQKIISKEHEKLKS